MHSLLRKIITSLLSDFLETLDLVRRDAFQLNLEQIDNSLGIKLNHIYIR